MTSLSAGPWQHQGLVASLVEQPSRQFMLGETCAPSSATAMLYEKDMRKYVTIQRNINDIKRCRLGEGSLRAFKLVQ